MKCFVLGAVGFIVSLSVKMLRGKMRVLEMHSLSLSEVKQRRAWFSSDCEKSRYNAVKFKLDSFQRTCIRGYKFFFLKTQLLRTMYKNKYNLLCFILMRLYVCDLVYVEFIYCLVCM